MAYEYRVEVQAAADAIASAVDLALDATPDQQQITQFLAAAMQAISALQGPLSAEDQKKFKLKLLAKLGVAVINRGLDQFVPDEPNA